MANYICTKKYAVNDNGKRRIFQLDDTITEKVFQKLSAVGKSCFTQIQRKSRANGNNGGGGVKPLEQKDHYLWVSTYLELVPRFADIEEGEMTVEQVWLSEELRALDLYQPKLDQMDTTKRKIISRRGKELFAQFAALGRQVAFDRNAYHDAVAVAFGQTNTHEFENGTTALKGIELDAFRVIARNELEELTRTVYPSVANR